MKWLVIIFKIILAAVVIFFGLGLLLTLFKPVYEGVGNEASFVLAGLSLVLAIYLFVKVVKRILSASK